MDGLAVFPTSDPLTVRRLDRSDLDAIMDLNAGQDDVMRHAKPAGYNCELPRRRSTTTWPATTDVRCSGRSAARGWMPACRSICGRPFPTIRPEISRSDADRQIHSRAWPPRSACASRRSCNIQRRTVICAAT